MTNPIASAAAAATSPIAPKLGARIEQLVQLYQAIKSQLKYEGPDNSVGARENAIWNWATRSALREVERHIEQELGVRTGTLTSFRLGRPQMHNECVRELVYRLYGELPPVALSPQDPQS